MFGMQRGEEAAQAAYQQCSVEEQSALWEAYYQLNEGGDTSSRKGLLTFLPMASNRLTEIYLQIMKV